MSTNNDRPWQLNELSKNLPGFSVAALGALLSSASARALLAEVEERLKTAQPDPEKERATLAFQQNPSKENYGKLFAVDGYRGEAEILREAQGRLQAIADKPVDAALLEALAALLKPYLT